MKRSGFKSLYFKFVVVFVGSLWFSSLVAFRIGLIYMQNNMITRVKNQLYEKAVFVLALSDKYSIDENDMKVIFKNENIGISFYRNIEDIPSLGIIPDQSQNESLEEGKIVEGRLTGPLKLPYVMVSTGESIVLLTPNMKSNFVVFSRNMISIVLAICATMGSVIIALAARMIAKPIKKLTAATKEVSKGNFDIKIKTKSKDEIGQLADNFNKMTEDLKNIEYLRKDFISSVSHEFRTPMTSIEGFAKLLRDSDIDSELGREYVDIIISETHRLSNMSSNLLRLSELDNKLIYDTSKLFSLDEQIRRVLLLLENSWSGKNIELNLELDEISFRGNEELMFQVWVNLISNAIKFSQKGGELSIVLWEEDGVIKVSISDRGTGIAEQDKNRIFERFYKGDKSRSKEGSGLGLSIVRKIIEVHGGKIYFESRLGYGTTFFVELGGKL